MNKRPHTDTPTVWAFLWSAAHLTLSFLAVLSMLLFQLYALLFILPSNPLTSSSIRRPSSRPTLLLTHLAVRLGVALAAMDALHNGSIAFAEDASPGWLLKGLTALVAGALALVSDWILAAGFVYALAAFAAGQARYYEEVPGWSAALWGIAVGVAVIAGVKNVALPPYVTERGGYERVEGEEEER